MGLFGRSKSQIKSPIAVLINYYYEVCTKGIDEQNSYPNEIQILKYNITSLDKQAAQNICKIEKIPEALNKFCPTFKFCADFLKIFLLFYSTQPKVSEGYVIIVCFQVLQWVYNESEKNPKDLSILIDCISLIKETPIRTFVNTITNSFLQTISTLPPEFCSDSFLHSFLGFLATNQYFQPGDFPNVTPFLKLISNSDNNELNNSLIKIIYDLDNHKSPVLQTDDIQTLTEIISPYIERLNYIGMSVLESFVLRCPENKIYLINNLFLLMATSLIECIQSSKQPYKYPENILTDPTLPKDCSLKSLTYQFITELNGNIKDNYPPPFEILEKKIDLDAMMSEQILVNIQEISSSFAILADEEIGKNVHLSFFETLLVNVRASSTEYYLQSCSCFLYILQNYKNKKFFEKNLIDLQKIIFTYNTMNVFQDGEFNICINTIRDVFIEILIDVYPELIHELILSLEENAFIFTELLIRILMKSKKINLTILNTKQFFNAISINALKLQHLNIEDKSELVQKTRNSIFIFMSELALNPLTSYSAISNSKFGYGYIRYIFEQPLSLSVLITVRNALSQIHYESGKIELKTLLLNLKNSIISCVVNFDDNMYESLCSNILNNLLYSFKQNPKISLIFEPLIEPFSNYILKQPNEKMLLDILTFYSFISSLKKNFEINESLLNALFNCIKSVYNDEPTTLIESKLFGLLRRTISSPSNSMFLISLPSALPLIIASFGKSKRIVSIIKYIQSLCDYSDYNRRLCHDGDLDLILSKFICMKPNEKIINYRGCKFELQFDKETIKNIVIPLMSSIIISKSSNINSHYLVERIVNEQNYQICDLLGKVISKCQNIPSPVFSLCYSDSLFDVNGVDSTDLNNNFTIHFMINLDIRLLMESNVHIKVLTLIDTHDNELILFINQMTLYAKYESNTTRTTVVLVKIQDSNVWTHITIVFYFQEKSILLHNYRNLTKLNDSELCNFKFNEGPVQVIFGGIDYQNPISPEWQDHQFGRIGDFQIFPFGLNHKEVKKLIKSPWKIMDKCLFPSNVIVNPSHNGTYIINRNKAIQKNIFTSANTKLKVNVYDTYPSPLSILDVMVNCNECNFLAKFFNHFENSTFGYTSMILGMIGQLFKRSLTTQKMFHSIDIIIYNLNNHSKMLSSDLYLSFINVFDNITFIDLKKQWFETFILNPLLWSKCSSNNFYIILKHWNSNLIETYKDIFIEFSSTNESYFSNLLHQYMILFCLKEDNSSEFDFNDNNQKLLNETYTNEMIIKCDDLFIMLLSRVAFIRLTKNDIENLFLQINNWKNKENLVRLLKLLCNISKPIINEIKTLDKYLLNLHSLLGNEDIDIIEGCLLSIIELTGNSCIPHLVSAGFQFNNYSNQFSILNRMKEHIEKPEIFPLLCILSLHLGDKTHEIICNTFKEIQEKELNVKTNSLWFIYPVLLSFKTNLEYTQDIYKFISYILFLENDEDKIINEINQICSFIFLIRNYYNFEINHYFLFLEEIQPYVIRSDSIKTFKAIIENAFHFTFYSFFINKIHHNDLIKLYNESIFYDNDFVEFEPKIDQQQQLDLNIEDDNFIINLPEKIKVNSLHQMFSLDLDENNNWKNLDVAKITVSLMMATNKTNEFSNYYNIFMNYIDKEQVQSDIRNKLFQNSEQFFEFNKNESENLMKNMLNKIFSNIKTEYEQIYKIIHEKSTNFDTKATENLTNEYENCINKIPKNINHEIILKRDFLSCGNCYCSPKFKIKKYYKNENNSELNLGKINITYKANAKLIKYSKIIEIKFQVTSDRYLLIYNHTKVIKFTQIQNLFYKRKMTAIEILLNTGKSYLIDFESTEPINRLILHPKPINEMRQFIIQNWLSNQFSNFETIMFLNLLSGRSYHDSTMYPIFPNILTNFDDINSLRNNIGIMEKPELNILPEIDVKDAINNHSILPVDFYTTPELINEVPEWATNSFDFIYKLRKNLESKYITENLHLWLQLIFSHGSLMNHIPIFDKPIQQKFYRTNFEKYLKKYELKLDGKVIVTSSRINENNLQTIINDGSILRIQYDINEGVKSTKVGHFKDVDIPQSIFYNENKKIALFSKDQHKSLIFENTSIISNITMFSELELIALCDDKILFCPDASTIAIVNENEPLKVLCNSNSRIIAIEASSIFKIFVFATIDGYLYIHNVLNGDLIKEINLGYEVRKILITLKWGLIVAFTMSNDAFVLNVNGNLIKRFK